MSIIKSSVINLYDGSGTHNYQSKVSSDRVELQSSTLPLGLKGTSISLTNQNGDTITDAVGTMKSLLEQITQLNSLTSDIEASPAPYKLSEMYGSFNAIMGITYADGTALSDDEKAALVGRYFTHRSLSNTAIIKLSGVHNVHGGFYLGVRMPGVPIGTDIIIIDPVEITGARGADYTVTASNSNGTIIDISHADGSELIASQKQELIGREFTFGAYDADERIKFTNFYESSLYLNSATSMIIGTGIFLV